MDDFVIISLYGKYFGLATKTNWQRSIVDVHSIENPQLAVGEADKLAASYYWPAAGSSQASCWPGSYFPQLLHGQPLL